MDVKGILKQALFVFVVLLTTCGTPETALFLPKENSTITLLTDAGPQALRVEIADQAVQWQRGLQGRAKLAEDLGMLFVFPDARVRKFWMRDTSIPLDLLFFNEQREVIAIQHNVPPCKEEPCPTFGPDTSAQYVLEVNSGWAKEHGIKLGDKIGQ